MSDKKKKTNDKAKASKKGDVKDAKPKPKIPGKMLEQIKKQQEEKEREERERLEKEQQEQEAFLNLQKAKEEEERKKQEKKEREKQKRKEKIERQKQEGTYLTAKQKQKQKLMRARMNVDEYKENVELESKMKSKPEKISKKKQNKNQNDLKEKLDEMNDETDEEENKEEEEDNEENNSDYEKTWEDYLDEEIANAEENSDNKETEASTESVNDIVHVEKTKDLEDENIYDRVHKELEEKHIKFEKERSVDKLRSPIICVLGHVDSGKTKILDKLRSSNVQANEVGGITQQIGATNVPIDNIKRVKERVSNLKLPGLLIIDTPGHESFSNMRNRGSNLCDIAILVVDIMHGIQEQTKECLQILKKKKVPFVIAFNKIDRINDWKTNSKKDIHSLYESQSEKAKMHFTERFRYTIGQIAHFNLNIRYFWEEDEQDDYVSVVPVSAHSGDGMDDLIAYLCHYSQNKLAKRLSFSNELCASVMEVKETTGHGTTLDLILVNGSLKSGDDIVLGGQEGPIVTKIRYILQPAPMAEMRVRAEYTVVNEVKAAQGVKLVAHNIDKAMPGMPVYRAENEDEVQYYRRELRQQIEKAISSIKLADKGIYVQTSTIGSLEALLEFLKQQQIPYSGINIGPIHKKDVTRASIMHKKEPKWAVILAFNVKVENEARILAESLNVQIFEDEIIYRLHGALTDYVTQLEREAKDRVKDKAIFPCKLKIMPQYIFQNRNPILVGVTVEKGILRMGTPLFAKTYPYPDKPTAFEVVEIGKAVNIELNNHPISEAKAGSEVSVRIDPSLGDTPKMLGRHFQATDAIYSLITRDSIDVLKEFYRDDMTTNDWKLVIEIKPIIGIN